MSGGDGHDEGYAVVMTTLGTEEAADDLARSAVVRGLAACAQLLPVRSLYRWQGALVDDREVLVLLKTAAARVPALTEAIRAVHPYEVPEILELPVAGGWPPYLRWVDGQTAAPG